MRELQLAVLALRRQRLRLVAIAGQRGLSRATVARTCARAGLNCLSQLEPAMPVLRYEWVRSSELLRLDIKKPGRIVRVRHRITGNPRDQVEGAGWEYVHVTIDDTSRVACAQVLPDETADSAIVFLRAADQTQGRTLHPGGVAGVGL